ncbi:MAG: PIN domain-containing protein, partial [Syntrophales bacterium]|nr:PIN domain-containing protein [Syntrophales bacterium]
LSMTKTHIIMDTNVLYAGLYSSLGASYRILRLIDRGIIIPVLSTTLLFEYEEILFRNQSELEIQDRQIEIILDNLCALGKFQKFIFYGDLISVTPKMTIFLKLLLPPKLNQLRPLI